MKDSRVKQRLFAGRSYSFEGKPVNTSQGLWDNPAMPLVTLQDAELAFGLLPLLDRAALVVDEREHVGLIGRNGTGKSSLLHVIHGMLALDEGVLKRRDGLRTILVEQEPALPPASTLRESLVLRGMPRALAAHGDDDRERWRVEARLVEYLHRFGLDEAAAPEGASGGERKRAALALAFALSPDLLLLDEPTNHLDLDGIALLEKLIRQQPASIVITHDRMFLDRVTTSIVELDRGLLRSYPGNFAAYEARKNEELAAESVANRKFDAFWRQEEAWIRRGVEARRTRDMGRVRRLERLRSERAERRERQRNVTMALQAAERSGKLVAELDHVTKRFGERTVVRDLDLRIMRGDRIGIVGPNGAGKSTLLKLILGTLEPDAGTVRLGTRLTVAYFDQMRAQLDEERTLADTISPGSEWIEAPGGRKHVLSYLGEFLFPPQRANAPVRTLSGGERNRLLLARLFAQPANLLVLDEPTNDLDIESLEILEETLQAFAGTLLLVSHDRAFLDNVVTQTIASEGDGLWKEYVGGYSDWIAQRPHPAEAPAAPASERAPAPRPRERPARLTWKEQRELEALPAELESLEREQIELGERMSSPDYYKQGAEALRADRARASEIEALLAQKLERWVDLEARATSAK
ncbi:MAG: ATP-binding cassette domain-containing protein [Burkholderiales bacterium]